MQPPECSLNFLHPILPILIYLFIGFNITVINYKFIAFLHWNSHDDSNLPCCFDVQPERSYSALTPQLNFARWHVKYLFCCRVLRSLTTDPGAGRLGSMWAWEGAGRGRGSVDEEYPSLVSPRTWPGRWNNNTKHNSSSEQQQPTTTLTLVLPSV